MQLDDGDAEASAARAALLEELSPERGSNPSGLFGAPRLERFLQGNDGSLDGAAAHFRKMLHWRSHVNMAERRKQIAGKPWKPESVPGLPQLLQCMRSDIESYTPTGDLIWVQCDGLARLDSLMKVSDDDLFNTIYLMCELRAEHLDALSERRGRLVKTVHVRDLSGLSIGGLLRDRAIMGRLKAVLSVVNLAYPENVSMLMLMNLPAGFHLLWAALQPIFNERIKRKFRFLGKDTYIAEIVEVVGSAGLEALVRARRHAAEDPSASLDVLPGSVEYACLRVQHGQTARWRFHVGDGGELQLRVLYVTSGLKERVIEVQAPAAVRGAGEGAFAAEEPGLLFLTWTNPSAWGRTRRIERLCLTAEALSIPLRPQQQRRRRAHRDAVCGCLDFWSLLAPRPDDSSPESEDATPYCEEVQAKPPAPRPLEPGSAWLLWLGALLVFLAALAARLWAVGRAEGAQAALR